MEEEIGVFDRFEDISEELESSVEGVADDESFQCNQGNFLDVPDMRITGFSSALALKMFFGFKGL